MKHTESPSIAHRLLIETHAISTAAVSFSFKIVDFSRPDNKIVAFSDTRIREGKAKETESPFNNNLFSQCQRELGRQIAN